MLKINLVFFLLFSVVSAKSQIIYSIDASNVSTDVKSGYFKMGNPGPAGKELLINSRYLTIGGVPQIPVMGELQYSRMPRDRWEEEILKMKACGVNVIATYSFWIHHEEIEGQFDFSGNKDLRAFVQLCKRLGVYVYPRIGPWSHGECRNGGTPDWILTKKYLTDRSLDPVYMHYVDTYFQQLGTQLKGLMYKDGGPVIGIQLANEYWKGKAGEPYMMWLKKTAQKYGMDVPLYTVTGWGDASVPPNEMIPLWGGYPDESWDPDIEKITSCDNYRFQSFRGDTTIGNEQVTKKEGYDYLLDPYFTCEMGVGIFNSVHRRPVIGRLDGLGMIMSRIGSGANLLGYYIFAGASNPLGIYSTMQEDKDQTGYWSALSPISYDFQAAIKEDGELAPSYYEVKKINYFLNDFGKLLAPMNPVFPKEKDNDLQYAFRANDSSGFLFGINYCRNNVLSEKKNIQFRVKLKNETVLFPSKPVDIKDSGLFIWPVNMQLNTTRLIYATAQPLCHLPWLGTDTWIFFQSMNNLPEFCFEDKNILSLTTTRGKIQKVDSRYLITDLQPSSDCVIDIKTRNGKQQRIIILSNYEAKYAWLLHDLKGEKVFFLSPATLYMKDNELHIADTIPDLKVKMLHLGKGFDSLNILPLSEDNLFADYRFSLPVKKTICAYHEKGALEDASWLVTSVKEITADNKLYHKEFLKEFNIGDPAEIKWAKLIIAPQSACRFRINDRWCEQKIALDTLNVLDITGYMRKGDNNILLDFPNTTGRKAFAARIIVEYFNTNRLDFSTDQSWLVTDQYYFPATYGTKPVFPIQFIAPEISTAKHRLSNEPLPDFREYSTPVSYDFLNGLNNLYLYLDYVGDRVSVRSNGKLIADNLNNNTTWSMDLKRNGSQMEGRNLQIEVRPWKNIDMMYFDKHPAKTDEGKAYIKKIYFVPEYGVVCDVVNTPR